MSLQLSDGTVFASRYRVVRRIAMGGMGAVYEVEHTETLRRLALKVMLPHIVQSAEMRDRFRREAQVAAHIESEHIVAVLDAGIDDGPHGGTGMPFMVMELLRGQELAAALRTVGRFGPVEATTYLHQAALALEKTHRALIVHRDLKPENLFLTEREDGQPRIKVLDFGIAKLVAEGSTQDPSTRSLGTPLYMAPEQFRSGQPISPATDVYALGMIAYTLLTGASYWAEEAKDSSNVFAFAGAVMAGPRELATVRARRRGVHLPAPFDAWFARVTALSAADRPTSALAAVAGLSEALGLAPFAAATTGSLRGAGSHHGAAPAPYAQPPAPEPAPTMLYLGGPTSPVAAAGPPLGPPAPPPPGAPAPLASGVTGPGITGPGPYVPTATGNGGYGSTAIGAPPTRSVGTGKIVAAVVGGIVLGGMGLVALLVLQPGGAPPAKRAPAASAPVTAPAPPTASAAAPAPRPQVSAAPAAPPASAAPAATAAPAVSAAVEAPAPSATATVHAVVPGPLHKAPPPADTAKKSIFVRD